MLCEAPKPFPSPLADELPHPPPKSEVAGAAAAVVLVDEVVGFASDQAFEEPQASKLEVRLIEGDIAAAGAGAGAGAGWDRLNAELE